MSFKIAYIRVSKSNGDQSLDLQIDAMKSEGIDEQHIYFDKASGKKESRPGLDSCLKALRSGDTLYVWKLDRLGRSLKHLIDIVQNLSVRGIGFKVLTGKGAKMDTTTASGKFIFGIFGALAEFERDLIRERTMAGLESARARGRKGGRKHAMTKAKVRLAIASMKEPDTKVSELCIELGVSRPTLYRYVGPNGELREAGKKVLGVV